MRIAPSASSAIKSSTLNPVSTFGVSHGTTKPNSKTNSQPASPGTSNTLPERENDFINFLAPLKVFFNEFDIF